MISLSADACALLSARLAAETYRLALRSLALHYLNAETALGEALAWWTARRRPPWRLPRPGATSAERRAWRVYYARIGRARELGQALDDATLAYGDAARQYARMRAALDTQACTAEHGTGDTGGLVTF